LDRNIKPSNNMSDEEMEDVISQLYRSAVAINCKEKSIKMTHNGIVVTKLDSCETVMPW
jgi:hypothetical protein